MYCKLYKIVLQGKDRIFAFIMYEEFARDLLCEVGFHQCVISYSFNHDRVWNALLVLVHRN